MFKSTLKRLLSVAAASAFVFTGINFAPAAEEADAADIMTAFEITENMQFGWNLGNTLDAYKAIREYDKDGNVISETYPVNLGLETETCWDNPETTKEMIKVVKDKGFKTIRIPTTWFQHVDESDNFKIDEAWFDRVQTIVDWCIEEDLYVILNMHHEQGWQNSNTLADDYERIKPFVTSVWSQIAERFGDYDQHLVFESMNEPRAVGKPWEWWYATTPEAECEVINKLNADIVETIRNTKSEYNDVRLIMIPSYVASFEPQFIDVMTFPEGDDYVAASIHAYSPYDFTMNDSIEDHSKFTGAYKTEQKRALSGLNERFIEQGIPVVLGEMGASNYGYTDARIDWAKSYATLAKQYGIPCVLWDNNVIENVLTPGEGHGYLDRKNLKWYDASEPVIDAFLEVFNDPSTAWGGGEPASNIEHEDISTGTVVFEGPFSIDIADKATYGDSKGIDYTWDLDGKDLAVKFTGKVPQVAISDPDWNGWTSVDAYDVDKEKGIAYFSMDELGGMWGDDKSTIGHISIATSGVTTVETAVAIKAAAHEATDKTKKFVIDLTKNDGADVLVVTFEGKPGSAIEGCVGWMGAEEWEQETFKDAIGADGKFVFEVTLGEGGIPANVTSAQAQIWYCEDEDAKMSGYTFGSGADQPTTSDQPTASGDVKYGDANCDGKISIADATAVLQSIVNNKKYALSADGERNADVDGEKGVTPSDAFVIQQVDAGIYTESDLPLAG